MKVKQWIKNHKKEIIAGAIAAGGTSLYFIAKNKKIDVKANLELGLRFIDRSDNEENPFAYRKNNYIHASFKNTDFTLKDLGKLGEMLREKFPMFEEDMKISRFNIDYDEIKK